MEKGRRRAVVAVLCLVLLFVAVGGPLLYWRFRQPSDLQVAPSLTMESWTAVPPDAHHSNTDLFRYKDSFLLVHATSPYHFASKKCRLVIRASADGRQWKKQAEIAVPGEDVRDPKFALIDGKLFLYFLNNAKFEPKPYTTSYCVSEDGINWTAPRQLANKGWLFWRPQTPDAKTFYVPAYWWEHGKATLFKSTDGIEWTEVGPIYSGDTIDETDAVFRPDGTLVMTGRLEMNPNYWGYGPQGHTLIGISSPPYTEWSLSRSYETRLDGPCLFQIGERTFAVGRRHVGGAKHMGSCWGRKRTSLYLVRPERLVFLSDLPSNGDTAYAGVVVNERNVLISYYSSPRNRDFFWLMGMFSNTAIEMAEVRIDSLNDLADARLAKL
ncbi:MAG: exo-alpha-sialidase [Candidatus Abyssobacteria bacterium SURF_5]|uniref:Exo-alpha-sialidase n=1 Tax=Abyssobacteria bacterium (strain SURF_5) TaxID=2093360 RepID=A0A3A4N8T1_ABYX5|nr:MAG: exo-alpha-sialidase [Candidatus Abyssubacteria bacterium SURF_5]